MSMAAASRLLRFRKNPAVATLEGYRAQGGLAGLRKALSMKPADVIQEVKNSQLKGRGGAGFPAGAKWGFVPATDGPKYLVVNADEGEPGTFKDKALLAGDPFRIIEGAVIAAHAARLTAGFLYIRGEFAEIARSFEAALAQARKAGLLGRNVLGSGLSFDLFVHLGAGAYICGEETALLESLEGKPGRPRLKPPFPAVAGAFAMPTLVNNVETLACVPLVLEMGGEAFHKLGAPGDGGTKLFGLSGHVVRPGLYEFPMGKNLKELIFEDGGGVTDGRALKAVIPGGSSTPVLLPAEIDVPLTFDALKKAGSMLGTGCATVIAEGTCMVQVAYRIASFYAHESCGQCSPCREGCAWMAGTIRRFEEGTAGRDEIDLLLSIAGNIMGRTICPLGEAAAMPIEALVKKFRREFEQHVELGRCPCGESLPW
jgi:NADH-quinone oxidoreductase subunit F